MSARFIGSSYQYWLNKPGQCRITTSLPWQSVKAAFEPLPALGAWASGRGDLEAVTEAIIGVVFGFEGHQLGI
jgi:hypothetical protein